MMPPLVLPLKLGQRYRVTVRRGARTETIEGAFIGVSQDLATLGMALFETDPPRCVKAAPPNADITPCSE